MSTKTAIPAILLALITTVPVLKDGKPVLDKDDKPKTRGLSKDEVLDWRYDSTRGVVIVVTVDGQKYRADVDKKTAEALTKAAAPQS